MSPPSASPVPIDRFAPAVRPLRRAVMRQNWLQLLFLHWVVAPEQLRPLVPPGWTSTSSRAGHMWGWCRSR